MAKLTRDYRGYIVKWNRTTRRWAISHSRIGEGETIEVAKNFTQAQKIIDGYLDAR